MIYAALKALRPAACKQCVYQQQQATQQSADTAAGGLRLMPGAVHGLSCQAAAAAATVAAVWQKQRRGGGNMFGRVERHA